MILLHSLKLENFLSYKKEIIEFPKDAQIDINGISGSGKSSIVDAIIWVLFGRGRSENRNLVKAGAKSCTVTLDLFEDKTNYRIERSVTKEGKQSIEISTSVDDGEYKPIEKTGLKDHQLWIEKELLHSSYTLFINSIAYPQENAESFVKQTASRRKDLLLEIARTEDYDLYYARAKDKGKLLSESLARSTTMLEMHKRTIFDNASLADKESTYSEQLTSLEAEIGSKELVQEGLKSKVSESVSLMAELNTNNSLINSVEKLMSDSHEWLVSKQAKIDEFSDIDTASLENDLLKLSIYRKNLLGLEEIERYNSIRQYKLNSLIANRPVEYNHDKTINELNKKLIDIMSHENTVCPDGKHCQCFIKSTKGNSFEIEKMLEETMHAKMIQEEAVRDYDLRIKDIGPEQGDGQNYAHMMETKKEIEKLLPSEKMKESYDSRLSIIASLKEEMDKINAQVLVYNSEYNNNILESVRIADKMKELDISKIREEERTVSDLLKQLKSRRDDCKHELYKVSAAKKAIADSEKEIESLNKKIHAENESLECVSYVKDAFGSKGIKTIVIDYLIPRLQNTINEILSEMSDFRVKLETQKKAVDGENIIDGLFISVFNENGEEFEFSSYSGGEKLRISVAISEALASVQNVGFRIFDEVFIGLNEALTDSFASVMVSLQQRFSQILCISHLRIIQDRFVTKLVVTKTGGVSSASYI